MNDQNVQTEQLQENEAVKQFLQLLMENRPDKGQDYSMMLWQMDRKEKRHPTEKPVAMIEHLVRCSTQENEVCLDPFMGSCSTGEACIKLNRRFIGVEIESRWFRTSQNRIKQL